MKTQQISKRAHSMHATHLTKIAVDGHAADTDLKGQRHLKGENELSEGTICLLVEL
jgi:hypothetical protein